MLDQDVDKTGIPRSLANKVTGIYNKRYDEFFKNDIYFVAFLLDPRMSISCVEIQANAQYVLGYPIEQFLKLTISIPSRSSMLVSQPLTIKYPRAYERLREYLRNMITPMLERIESSTDSTIGHPVLREKGVSTSVRDLKCQIELFWNGEYPFRVIDIEKVTDPLAWWRDIGRHDGAKVLSVRNINYCNGTKI